MATSVCKNRTLFLHCWVDTYIHVYRFYFLQLDFRFRDRTLNEP